LRNFDAPHGQTYVDSASYGLPPRSTVAALEGALQQWRAGTANWITDWDPAGDECRVLLAELLAVPVGEVALLPTVSAGVAALAASLDPGDEVVIPEDEFNSLLLPFLVAERHRGCRVRRVPFHGIVDAITDETTVVATSHVRSNGGAIQDLDALGDAASAHGAMVVVDATHSAGILPLEIRRGGLDIVYFAAYKHLLCPRGVAFMWVAAKHHDRLRPYAASWRSTASPYASYYGAELDDLAPSAARFDLSLAWHAWIGARESLRFLLSIPEEDRRSWCVGLASELADSLDLPATGSSILGIPVAAHDREVRELLQSAGVVASMPLGQVRVSFHVYNTPADLETVASVLRDHVARRAVGRSPRHEAASR
jgi:selenocysteine lyase/cysteine desulfurase